MRCWMLSMREAGGLSWAARLAFSARPTGANGCCGWWYDLGHSAEWPIEGNLALDRWAAISTRYDERSVRASAEAMKGERDDGCDDRPWCHRRRRQARAKGSGATVALEPVRSDHRRVRCKPRSV